MEVFTIVANEVIGLSATECTLIQFSYNPEQIRDPETVLRSAVNDFLSGDISREAFWALAKFKHPTHQISFHTEVALKCLSFKEAIEV